MRLSVVQTLHGYDGGHRLLARSEPLEEGTLALLDRLTDLSGYLPPGFEFDRYVTGYPAGRHYVVASTWPHRSAPRRGTVYTHSLLIPNDAIGALRSLTDVLGHLRRPSSERDLDPYAAPLSLDLPGDIVDASEPLATPLDAALTLLGSLAERPVICVDGSTSERWISSLWALLWPEARSTFSFCTMALGQRRLPRRAFDLLVVPPEARSSFTELARQPTWFDPGFGAAAALHEEMLQPWARRLITRGRGQIDELLGWCARRSLPPPALSNLRALSRIIELAEVARDGVAAARSRADLLKRLWPELAATHTAMRESLDDLVTAQRTAPLEPRPLWDIVNLLGRPEVGVLADEDPAFRGSVERMLVDELPRRIANPTTAERASLIELLRTDATRQRWGEAIIAALASQERDLVPLLGLALETGMEGAFLNLLGRCSREERASAVRALASSETSQRDVLVGWLEVQGDPFLYFVAAEQITGEDAALRATTERVHRWGDPDAISEVLGRLSPERQLQWALERSEPTLRDLAVRTATEAARRLRLSFGQIVLRTRSVEHLARVVFELLPSVTEREVAETLANTPLLAEQIAPLILERASAYFMRRVFAALPDQAALGPSVRELWLTRGERVNARDAITLIGPHVVRAAHEVSAHALVAPWLDDVGVRLWIEAASDRELLSVFSGGYARGSMATSVCAAARASLDRCAVGGGGWVLALLRPSLRNATSSDLEACTEDLVELIERTEPGPLSRKLAAEVLALTRRSTPHRGWRIVEATFPKVYPALQSGQENPFAGTVWNSSSWDRAKDWRHWLLDVWVGNHWPQEPFLRCLSGDDALFVRIARRAWKSSARSRIFISRLPAAGLADPALAELWERRMQTLRSGWDPWQDEET